LAISLLNKEDFDQAVGIIKLMRDIFSGMVVDKGWKPCQTHVVVACEVVLALIDDLVLSGRYDFVMFGRLLQDLIENLFSVIRMQSPNPTPLQFKNRLKQVTLSQFMEKIDKSSYYHDDRQNGVDLLLSHSKAKVEVPSPVIPDGLLSWSYPQPTSDPKAIVSEGVLYRMCGYVLSRLINRGSIKCDGCIEALKHGKTHHERSLFTALTNYKENAQYEVSDAVFQMCRAIEHNLVAWKRNLKEDIQVPISYLTSKCVLPALASYTLSTCHDVKCKFAATFVEMRMKQFSGKPPPKPENCFAQNAVALSSKSTGSRLLADNYKPRSIKKSASLQRVARLP